MADTPARTHGGRALLDLDLPFCSSGHRPIPTEDEARRKLALARAGRTPDEHRGRRPGVVESAFYGPCVDCKMYHLTSTPKRGDRSSRANKKRRR